MMLIIIMIIDCSLVYGGMKTVAMHIKEGQYKMNVYKQSIYDKIYGIIISRMLSPTHP